VTNLAIATRLLPTFDDRLEPVSRLGAGGSAIPAGYGTKDNVTGQQAALPLRNSRNRIIECRQDPSALTHTCTEHWQRIGLVSGRLPHQRSYAAGAGTRFPAIADCKHVSDRPWRGLLRVAPDAAAAGYGTNSQGDCSKGFPEADSWLNWWGYFPASSGSSDGMQLVKYDPHPVTVDFAPFASVSGSDGNADQYAYANTGTGHYWVRPGHHWSSFFSGTIYDNDNYFTCP